MTKNQMVLAAACLARIRLGLPRPSRGVVQTVAARGRVNAIQATEFLFPPFMDGSSENFAKFFDETWSQLLRVRRRGDAVFEDDPWLREVLL